MRCNKKLCVVEGGEGLVRSLNRHGVNAVLGFLEEIDRRVGLGKVGEERKRDEPECSVGDTP